MTYAQLAEWRRILHRLSQFLHLVDLILQEMLRSIVERALDDLTRFVAAASEAGRELNDGVVSIMHSHSHISEEQEGEWSIPYTSLEVALTTSFS